MKNKILILLGDLNRCNGITSYVMNYYKYLNHEQFDIDFVITNNDIDPDYQRIIEENNSKIFFVPAPSIKTMIRDFRKMKSFLKEHLLQYDMFYCHLLNQGYFYLRYARKLGFHKRVFHSHNIVTREKNKLRDFRNQLFKHLVSKEADYYFACSDLAGIDLLGKKQDYQIINNAIEVKEYIYDETIRKKIRKDFNIEDKLVCIQVGRLAYQKNPEFSLKFFQEFQKKIPNAFLIFVGSGVEEDKLKQMVNDNHLDQNVLFLGTRNDVNHLLMAADIFLFPSRFEGLGMVAIEAQVSGLPCYISNAVPRETKILDTTEYLSTDDIKLWVDVVSNQYSSAVRKDYSALVRKQGYDIEEEVKTLETILHDICIR